jgi:hypothetical protein
LWCLNDGYKQYCSFHQTMMLTLAFIAFFLIVKKSAKKTPTATSTSSGIFVSSSGILQRRHKHNLDVIS